MDQPTRRRGAAAWAVVVALFGPWPLTFHRWFHQKLWRGDVLWAVLLSMFTLFSTAQLGQGKGTWGYHGHLPPWFTWVWGLAYFLPTLVRRTHPLWCALALVPAHVVQLALTDQMLPGNVVIPFVVYAAARYEQPRRARIVLGLSLLGSVAAGTDWGLALAHSGNGALASRAGYIIANTIPCAAVVLACWFWGQWSRQRALTLQSLQERADALEREREQGIKLVAQEERNRLAREMHDIVAHSLSVIVVQADGAGYLAGHAELGDPEARLAQVTRAIETIGQTARTALGETRRLVGVLRDDVESPAELAPAATLDQIGELVDQVRQAGLPASFAVTGSADAHPPLPAGAEMATYRVVQESLTNVLKHAGPGATVEVALAHTADGLDVAVRDTGAGATDTDGLGHGVVGMRERVAVWGGTLVARPRATGGFEVLAHVPAHAEPRPSTTPTKDAR